MTAPTDQAERTLRLNNRHMRLPMLRTISALILREMTSTYGRSPGGYAWIVLEPMLGVALLSAIFAIGFRSPQLGDNFAIFYATGLLPYMMFMSISNAVAQSLNYSKSLLAYPRVTFVDAILARFILNLLTQLMVNVIVIALIRMTWETRTTVEYDTLLLVYAMLACLSLGIGTLNCFLFTMFPLWQRGWSIFTRPLFLVSGIILIFEIVPRPYNEYLWYNPLMHVTSMSRSAYYFDYEAKWTSALFVFAVAFITGLLGLVFLYRYHRDMMEL